MLTFLRASMAANPSNLVLLLFVIICVVALAILRGYMMKRGKTDGKWRLLFFVPLAASLIHILFGGALPNEIVLLYLLTVLIALWGLLRRRKYLFRVGLALMLVCCLVVSVLVIMSSNVKNYMMLGYVEAYNATHNDMKANYVLAKWKNIDFDAQYLKCLPLFQKAESDGSAAEYYVAWLTYCYYYFDGHVSAIPSNKDVYLKAKDILAGNDYGLSLISLENGQTVAILVEEDSEAYRAGIRTGTVITKWDGKTVNEGKQNIQCIYPMLTGFPVAENEAYYKSFFLAGRGGEQLQVEFIDANGTAQTVLLRKMGSYATRLDRAIDLFQQSSNLKKSDQLSWDVLQGGHGYLRVAYEGYQETADLLSYLSDDHPQLDKKLESIISDMKAKGAKDLILDLRNNTGGYDTVGMEIFSQFSNSDQFYFADGKIQKDGTYAVTHPYIARAEKEWLGIPIVVLVNAETVSAGDGLAWNLAKLDNVTLMGFTSSCSSFQTTGGCSVNSLAGIVVNYPVTLQLDEDSSVMIDTHDDRISELTLDKRIPLSIEAIEAIYENGEDYELEYAVQYLDSVQ